VNKPVGEAQRKGINVRRERIFGSWIDSDLTDTRNNYPVLASRSENLSGAPADWMFLSVTPLFTL
jgi:hypothetical protein